MKKIQKKKIFERESKENKATFYIKKSLFFIVNNNS